MNSGLITCPCCGQTLYISYSELLGWCAQLAIFNRQTLNLQNDINKINLERK